MAHCRILFVGTKENMETIFENCSDSSSESKAEMAFSCDSIGRDRWNDWEFTKQDDAYKDILLGAWVYCYDIRNANHYGDYACLHDLGIFNLCSSNEEKAYKAAIIEHIKTLPDDTIFFFQDGHY